MAGQGAAWQGRRGKARLGLAWPGRAWQAWHGWARQGGARHGRRGKARPGRARRGRQGTAGKTRRGLGSTQQRNPSVAGVFPQRDGRQQHPPTPPLQAPRPSLAPFFSAPDSSTGAGEKLEPVMHRVGHPFPRSLGRLRGVPHPPPPPAGKHAHGIPALPAPLSTLSLMAILCRVTDWPWRIH